MTPIQGGAVFGAAVIAGAINSVAGGGSFISYPTLVFVGLPEIRANATNTLGLFPGMLASAGAYRAELKGQGKQLVVLSFASLIGSILGAMLLLGTPERTFVRLLPFLLLFAAVVFTFGGGLAKRLKARMSHIEVSENTSLAGVAGIQVLISIYGGYFGGGMGILMLASLTLMGMSHIHSMNALKAVLGGLINAVAAALFVARKAIIWPYAIVMIAGALVGGYAGAYVARRIDAAAVRKGVLVFAWGMTAFFFWKTYA